jgi:hypothetical protein
MLAPPEAVTGVAAVHAGGFGLVPVSAVIGSPTQSGTVSPLRVPRLPYNTEMEPER